MGAVASGAGVLLDDTALLHSILLPSVLMKHDTAYSMVLVATTLLLYYRKLLRGHISHDICNTGFMMQFITSVVRCALGLLILSL